MLSLAALCAAAPAVARADVYCPQQISIFGAVDSVNGNEMTVNTTSNIGHIHVIMNRPTMNTHGLQLRPGVFVGVYGCLQQGGRAFDADEVTLAPSSNAYNNYERPERIYQGRITQVGNGGIRIAVSGGTLWVQTSAGGFRNGQNVHVRGYFDPYTGKFMGSRVEPM